MRGSRWAAAIVALALGVLGGARLATAADPYDPGTYATELSQCFKHFDEQTPHGVASNGAVTLSAWQAGWFGDHWTRLVLGSVADDGSLVVTNFDTPTPGVAYAPSAGALEWWVACKGTSPAVTAPPTTTPPVETTAPPVETTAPPVVTTAPPVVTTAPPVATTPVVTQPPSDSTLPLTGGREGDTAIARIGVFAIAAGVLTLLFVRRRLAA